MVVDNWLKDVEERGDASGIPDWAVSWEDINLEHWMV